MDVMLRNMVSKEKKRYTDDGFDLDLTYITPRIIAMGAPSEGQEAIFRNPMGDVQRLLELRHEGHYKVYDLRAEKGAAYDPKCFKGRVAGFRFFDHNPPPLMLLKACCEDIAAYLAADAANVVAIHCKAGKGRTGCVIAALLVHLKLAPTASSALGMFGDVRTNDGKGVTIPSQMRYVHYFEALSKGAPATPFTYHIRHVRLHTVPNFDVKGGSDPFFDVRLGDGKECIFNLLAASGGKVKHFYPKAKIVDLDVASHNIRVKGDVKLVFYDYDDFGPPEKMFHLWIHTAFIENNYLLLHKNVLDRACKDKRCKEFEPDFKVEIFLDRVEEREGEFANVRSTYLQDDVDVDEDEDESKESE